MSPRLAEQHYDSFVQRHLRRNILALGADFALYMVGLAFASQATILPAFAASLGASNVVIGAIPAVTTLGWLLPSLFVAGHTEALPRKLPFMLRYTVWERAPYLVLALVAFAAADRAPAASLAVVLLVLLVTTGVSGALMPAWMDIVGHAVPVTLRGRFFAVSSTVSSLGGLAASFGTAWILAVLPGPSGFGACFLGASAFMALSYAALLFTLEPPALAPAPPGVSLADYLRRIPALLRADANMSWFIAARSCAIVGGMATGFFTVYALRAFAVPAWQVGVFTTMLLAGQLAGNLTFGWLADRTGHRLVLAVGALAMVGANVAALCTPSARLFGIAFALDGVYDSAMLVSGVTILLEMSPSIEQRPTYVGLGRTAVAPVAFGAPLIAGLLVDAAGFSLVFALAGLFAALGFGLMIARVRDPVRAAR
ncbi:MAG TPA: MFS transporter [Candidatus Methylomirabilis sp.]|nr:MFS transporter [Candidatus Methylomirabilis sp.]